MTTVSGTVSIRPRKRAERTSLCVLPLLVWSVLLLAPGVVAAAVDHSSQEIHSVLVTGQDTADSTNAIRKALIEKLKKNGSLTVAATEQTADAVLRVKSVIWQTGTVSLNPRSNSNTLTNYQGYASAELSSRSNQTLWSYLATPARYRFVNITDDLAGQLSARLIDAATHGFAPATALTPGAPGPGVQLRVAGATFPAPLYLKWFEAFKQQPAGFSISYDAIGSVAGIEQLAAGKIDMAASDIPGTDVSTPGAEVLRFPSVVGGVVPIFNLPGAVHDLNLTPQLLADIYSGTIRKWNDPRIWQSNRGAHLPDAAIVVVHRSDGSGTTFVWTSYLAEARPEWRSRAGATADWPVGIGEAGNEGVANRVATTSDAIGYVELTYAIQHHLNYASVRNPAGRFIKADLSSLTAAAAKARLSSGDKEQSLLNAPAKNAYPIATFTYFLVRKTNENPREQAALSAFLHWMLTSGQKQCSALGYAPLSRDLLDEELQTLNALK